MHTRGLPHPTTGRSSPTRASKLATLDDLAVKDGLLAVDVRPWNVMFHTLV